MKFFKILGNQLILVVFGHVRGHNNLPQSYYDSFFSIFRQKSHGPRDSFFILMASAYKTPVIFRFGIYVEIKFDKIFIIKNSFFISQWKSIETVLNRFEIFDESQSQIFSIFHKTRVVRWYLSVPWTRFHWTAFEISLWYQKNFIQQKSQENQEKGEKSKFDNETVAKFVISGFLLGFTVQAGIIERQIILDRDFLIHLKLLNEFFEQ